jgi:hypothetical protein
MRALTGRPEQLSLEDLQAADPQDWFMDLSMAPIRMPAMPQAPIFLRVKGLFTLNCGDRDIFVPLGNERHRGETSFEEAMVRGIGQIGQAIFGAWNIGLARGVLPARKEREELGLGWDNYHFLHGHQNVYSGLRWLTGWSLRSGGRLDRQANRLLSNIVVLPADSRADIQNAPGLHPSRWTAKAPGWLTIDEIAGLAGVSVKTVRDLQNSLSPSLLVDSVGLPRNIAGKQVRVSHYSPEFARWVVDQIEQMPS